MRRDLIIIIIFFILNSLFFEILTNGGNIFAFGNSDSATANIISTHSPFIMNKVDHHTSTPSQDHAISSAISGGDVGGNRSISSPILLIRDEHDHHANLLIEAIRNDQLRKYETDKIRQAEWYALTAAKLIAPYIDSGVDGDEIRSSDMMMMMIHQNNNNKNNHQEDNGRTSTTTATTSSMKMILLASNENGSVGAGYDWCLDQIRKMANAVMTESVTVPSNGTSSTKQTQNDYASPFSSNKNSSTITSALNFTNLADELELYKGVKHLRAREFDQAIETLKLFEKKDKLLITYNNNIGGNRVLVPSSSSSTSSTFDVSGGGANSKLRSASARFRTFTSTPAPSTMAINNSTIINTTTSSITPTHGGRLTRTSHSRVAATAATNLSFLYLLQQEYDIAASYADEAIAADRYCTGGLLNRGNVYYHQGDYQRAIDYYRDVINTNPNCLEAYYNLSLAERRLGHYDRALE